MKSSFIVAVLLLAIGFNPIAARAGANKSTNEGSGEHAARSTPSKCDAVLDNLVGNCGFETHVYYPWVPDQPLCFCGITAESRFSGNFGLQDAGLGSAHHITQFLPTVAGQQYSLSFWLQNTGKPNSFRVRWDGQLIYELVDAYDFPWTQVQIDGLFASRDGSELSFGFYNQNEWWFFDDVVVVPCPTCPK